MDEADKWCVSLLFEDWVKSLEEVTNATKYSEAETQNATTIFLCGCEVGWGLWEESLYYPPYIGDGHRTFSAWAVRHHRHQDGEPLSVDGNLSSLHRAQPFSPLFYLAVSVPLPTTLHHTATQKYRHEGEDKPLSKDTLHRVCQTIVELHKLSVPTLNMRTFFMASCRSTLVNPPPPL